MTAQPASPPDMESYKILVVEDNPHDRALYKRILDRSGKTFEIYEAANVNDGLQISSQQPMDCILLDYQLPDGDGIDFIKSCRATGLDPETAIVMVTGQGSEQTAVEAMKLGALDYIAKNTVIDGFLVQSVMNAIERAHLKRQVREYQEKLEKSYHDLSEFTHTVSHDLKAPLRRMIQYCDILKDEMGEKLGPDGQNYVNRLGVSAKRLQTLVDDLLTYARTMNTKEEKTALDFDQTAHEVIDDLKTLIEDNGAVIVVRNLPIVPAYPVRIKELFQNLIENALKYKSTESPPLITISCENQDSHYLFSVQDNGPGIEEKYHESIFKPFERLHTQDAIEGSGLGLSICNKAVEMHSGRIWVESSPGQGSVFKFTVSKA